MDSVDPSPDEDHRVVRTVRAVGDPTRGARPLVDDGVPAVASGGEGTLALVEQDGGPLAE